MPSMSKSVEYRRCHLTGRPCGARIDVLYWRHDMEFTSILEVRSSSSVLFVYFMLIEVV